MPGCRQIFANEQGTHLFLPAAGGTVPVQVFVHPLGADEDPLAAARALYARHSAWRSGQSAGDKQLADDP